MPKNPPAFPNPKSQKMATAAQKKLYVRQLANIHVEVILSNIGDLEFKITSTCKVLMSPR